jgi:integrase
MPIAKLTQNLVERTKHSGVEALLLWDERLTGFGVAVYASGTKRFIIQFRVKGSRRSRRMVIGSAARLDLEVARKRAKELLGHVDLGRDPLAEQLRVSTFRALAETYFAREGSKIRTANKRRAVLERLVLPVIGGIPVEDIKRSDIIRMLDRIEDESGPGAADTALAYTRRIFSWHEERHDDFRSPIGKMKTRRTSSRERVLTDDEIRAVWGVQGFWGDFSRLLLLTAARRTELAEMTRDELGGGLWTIPGERVKNGKEVARPLSRAAQQMLSAIPTLDGCRFVFTTDGRGPVTTFSTGKASIDEACGVKGWTFHDLRRTARTLLSRAGVDADTAERCLGHAIGGVRGVYDRHKYEEQMRVAFERLAQQIKDIIDPPTGRVVPLRG